MITVKDTFAIEQVPSDEDDFICFQCIGSIDAHAAPVLADLFNLPSRPRILLDFSQVKRVNSMGLSLLLKLFEDWESTGKTITVTNSNRMTSMLFKITGLGRFLHGNTGRSSANPTPKRQSRTVMANPAPPFHTDDSVKNKSETTFSANSTLRFMANLQSGQQLSGWYLLNTYLQRRLNRAIHLEQPKLGEEVTQISTELLFSKPFDACSIMKQRGFLPIMRPTDEADEVVILFRFDDDRDIPKLAQPTVVTASKNNFVYILGRSLCDESGLDSESFNFRFAGNEIKALQMLLKGQADLLFMLKKTYEGLSSFARNSTQLLYQSATNFAYHLFCCAPYLGDLESTLGDVLKNMNNDIQGKQILDDIQIKGWCKPEQGELEMLKLLFNRYQI